MATSVDWYFDFVSPYSYICLNRLGELDAQVCYKPVLFAGMLQHWGQKGPAEIPAKRKWTYRWCTWWANELGITFRFPGQHPFNPLPYLRLAIAAGASERVVRRIFEVLWTTGDDALHERRYDALCKEFKVGGDQIETAKDKLRTATAEAVSRGVFGVPSFVVDGEVFWGADALDFLKAFLADEAVLRNDEMRRVDSLPVGAARRG
jgi:2-hydroxychromene-2-carboxylate isomerase